MKSETRFVIQEGFQGTFEAKVPAHYFGNTIGGRTVTMKVKDLVAEGSLGRVAAEVNKTVAETTDEKVKEAVENWIKSPDMRWLGGFTEGGLMLSFGLGKSVVVKIMDEVPGYVMGWILVWESRWWRGQRVG
ncbi:hypothetical protein LINGRAHAP2_LOCUS7266 [Linum grandiflorum]